MRTRCYPKTGRQIDFLTETNMRSATKWEPPVLACTIYSYSPRRPFQLWNKDKIGLRLILMRIFANTGIKAIFQCNITKGMWKSRINDVSRLKRGCKICTILWEFLGTTKSGHVPYGQRRWAFQSGSRVSPWIGQYLVNAFPYQRFTSPLFLAFQSIQLSTHKGPFKKTNTLGWPTKHWVWVGS